MKGMLFLGKGQKKIPLEAGYSYNNNHLDRYLSSLILERIFSFKSCSSHSHVGWHFNF